MPRIAAPRWFFLFVLCTGVAGAGPLTLLSKADLDKPSDTPGGPSEVTGISADGRYVVFLTNAANLLEGVEDANSGLDVFLHDRVANTIVLVSHAAGEPSHAGNNISDAAAMSADGRYVAFRSLASNLLLGQNDDGQTYDIFLYDRVTGSVTLVSHAAGSATTAAGECWSPPDISSDGGQVVFNSAASNLVTGQSDGSQTYDVFLWDRATGTNTLVSHHAGSATTASGAFKLPPIISADGNWLVFSSRATDLVSGQSDTNGWEDLFLYERTSGTNSMVTHVPGLAATAANNFSQSPQISTDGNRIVYVSRATNLVASQTDSNLNFDIFLYDRTTGTNTLVSHSTSSATTAGSGFSDAPSMSADGRYIAFYSSALNLVADDGNEWWDVFLYDQATGTTSPISRAGTSSAFGDSTQPRISADGSTIGFLSTATNLVTDQLDAPYTVDVFLWSRSSGAIALMTHESDSASVATGLEPTGLREGDLTTFRISADGSWVALTSRSEGLTTAVDDFNDARDVFLYERELGRNIVVTRRGGAPSASAGGDISYWNTTAMSNDGRYVVFTSGAPNLVPGVTDENRASDVFVYDRVSGTTRLVSHAADSLTTAASGDSRYPVVSTDGSTILFGSTASNLIPDQVSSYGQNSRSHCFLYNRATGGITLVSHAASSPSTTSNGRCGINAVSGDGRWVAFSDFATDLVPGQVDGNVMDDVFLFDRSTGTNILVSHASSSLTQTGNGYSLAPAISADGRYVAFASTASNLVAGQAGAGSVFLYDRITSTTTRVSSSSESRLAISADGHWVVFSSDASNIVPGQVDTNGQPDVFLWDRVSGATTLVSHIPGSSKRTGNGFSDFGTSTRSVPTLSADGRWVAFLSTSSNLVTGQTEGNSSADIFLFDRITGVVTLVSHSAASPILTGNSFSSLPAISADGRFVAFLSVAADLVTGQIDENKGRDFFLFDRLAGTTVLMSHRADSESTTARIPPSIDFVPLRISADGAWVTFASPSPDLVAGDLDGLTDAFVYANPLPGRDFFTLVPCRMLDTRQDGQGPELSSGVERTIKVFDSCGIPTTARSIVVNLTVIQSTGAGYLTLHPGDTAAPLSSSINLSPGSIRANNAILALAFDGTGTLAVTPFIVGNGTVHLMMDVTGYFQ